MSISGEVKRRLAALFGTAGKEVSDTLDDASNDSVTLASTVVTVAANAALLDVTPGTATASKAVVLDASKDISGLGEVSAASFVAVEGVASIAMSASDALQVRIDGSGTGFTEMVIFAGIAAAAAEETDANGDDGANLVLEAGVGGAGDGEGNPGAHGLIILNHIPTSDPGVAGALFTTAGALQVSAGS
jgi:hypothetical protein